MAQNHLYLVDGSGYIFRAYHRLPPLTDPHGTPVGAVYGFTAMLWKLIEELNKAEAPTHLLVVFDAGTHTFRNAMYDGYKAQRPPPPEDLVPQFPLIRDAVRAFSIKCLEQEGFEADDIIASYSLAALKEGWDVTIVSSDKDLMQLVQPGLDMYDTMKNCRINRDDVIAKFGVGPEQVGEVLALMGDSVDNVPGVRGVGPKGAAELIQQFGTVEAMLSRLDEVKRPKLRGDADRTCRRRPPVAGAGAAERRPAARIAAGHPDAAGAAEGAAGGVPRAPRLSRPAVEAGTRDRGRACDAGHRRAGGAVQPRRL